MAPFYQTMCFFYLIVKKLSPHQKPPLPPKGNPFLPRDLLCQRNQQGGRRTFLHKVRASANVGWGLGYQVAWRVGNSCCVVSW